MRHAGLLTKPLLCVFISFPQLFLGPLFSPTVVSLQLVMLVVHSVILCPHSIQQDCCIFFVHVALASFK